MMIRPLTLHKSGARLTPRLAGWFPAKGINTCPTCKCLPEIEREPAGYVADCPQCPRQTAPQASKPLAIQAWNEGLTA